MASSCTIRVISDQPRQAVIAQSCAIGPTRMVNRTTLSAVSDRAMSADIEATVAGSRTKTHIDSTYLGPCSAAETAAARPVPGSPFSRIPAEQCRSLAQARNEMAGLDGQCAQMPGAYQAQCRARIQASRDAFKAVETACTAR